MDDLDRHIQEQVEADPAFADLLREAAAELDFGLALAHLREKRGWTQRELASRAGMPQSAIARLEKAGRTPTLATLWRLADALDAAIMLCPGYTVRLLDRVSEAAPATMPAMEVSAAAAMRTAETLHLAYSARSSFRLVRTGEERTAGLTRDFLMHVHGIHPPDAPAEIVPMHEAVSEAAFQGPPRLARQAPEYVLAV